MSGRRLPPALRTCAGCAEQTAAKFRCARCHTPHYCSRPCQVAHWTSGGHKKCCAGLARARRDTNLEVQSRALARVAHMSGGAPDDAHCLTCLDRGDAADPLVRGCACRGSSGWSHVGCMVETAEATREPSPPGPFFAAWIYCPTCKQPFTGLVQLRLAIALWLKYARALEVDDNRLLAAASYADALGAAGEPAEAARLERGIINVHTRVWGPEHRDTLTCASNLACSLLRLGECAEAAALLRTTLAARTRTVGADDKNTLVTAGHLVRALISLGEYAEAEALGRGTLEKRCRVLGRDHRETLVSSSNLAVSLSEQGKHAEAAGIEREILVSTTRLLGAEHEETLISAANLAASLSKCGQKTEAGQLLRETLALSRRALGPTHAHTQCVLRCISANSF